MQIPSLRLINEMLSRKKTPTAPQPFSVVLATRWLAEYSGVLPHSAEQGSNIEHSLFCTRFNPVRRDLFLAEGIELPQENPPTHILWCMCKLAKDGGNTRLLFRRNLYLPSDLRPELRDWIAFKLTQGIYYQLSKLTDFYFLIPCKTRKEYNWCAQESALCIYWEMEIASRIKKLLATAQQKPYGSF